MLMDVDSNWIYTRVPPEYEDDELYEIILFFVIHSPCKGQSSNGISLQERGWKEKPWYSPGYLKDKLDKAIFRDAPKMLKMVKNKSQISKELEILGLGEDFFNHREKQRAVYTEIAREGCQNEYMSLFYHMRNSLAHGRIAMYPAKGNDVIFVMEDGSYKKNEFCISARIVLNKSSLIRVINLLKNPPKYKDYTEDVFVAIKSGCNTKYKIIRELAIDENAYVKSVQSLKFCNRIAYENKSWKII